jgi:hypothetical protein
MATTDDKAALWFGIGICMIAFVYSLYGFIFVMIKSKFKWVQGMLFLATV